MEAHLLSAFERRAIMRAASDLASGAEIESRRRKRLREPLDDLPEATWQVRVRGRHRLLYCVRMETGHPLRTVEILRVIIKERETTADSLRRYR